MKTNYKPRHDLIKKQLGVRYKTASSRLDRKLLFFLAQKCGMDICYRCGKRIEDISDFDRDHKEPYLHKDNAIELYSNVENVGFSHKSCNRAAARCSSIVRGSSGFK